MIVQEVVNLLQQEDQRAEAYTVRLGKSHAPRWSAVAGGVVTLRSPDIWRRVVGIEVRDGRVALVQEDESQLALADR